MNKKRLVFIIIGIIIILITVLLLYLYNSILHKQYTNADFNIETYVSNIDKDNDGIDDQTDILNNVRNYISKNPKYKSKYYETGYPNDEYGVCTDVVAFGLKDAGYDLMELVNEDIHNNREKYNIENVDRNIDFRRVRNLDIYFRNNHTKNPHLTIEIFYRFHSQTPPLIRFFPGKWKSCYLYDTGSCSFTQAKLHFSPLKAGFRRIFPGSAGSLLQKRQKKPPAGSPVFGEMPAGGFLHHTDLPGWG